MDSCTYQHKLRASGSVAAAIVIGARTECKRMKARGVLTGPLLMVHAESRSYQWIDLPVAFLRAMITIYAQVPSAYSIYRDLHFIEGLRRARNITALGH